MVRENDAFDDAGALAPFASALVEVFSARTGAIEHFRRSEVVDGAAKIAVGVSVHPNAPSVNQQAVLLTRMKKSQKARRVRRAQRSRPPGFARFGCGLNGRRAVCGADLDVDASH